jgi:hypothetical protein
MQLVGLNSFRTAAVLLGGLLCYDVFWVFGSPSVVGDNVMLSVATSEVSGGAILWAHVCVDGRMGVQTPRVQLSSWRAVFVCTGTGTLCWSSLALLSYCCPPPTPPITHTQLLAGPTRLLFPRIPGTVSEAASFPFSLLGLGDVAVPGLLACLTLRWPSRPGGRVSGLGWGKRFSPGGMRVLLYCCTALAYIVAQI